MAGSRNTVVRAADYFYPDGGRARFVVETLGILAERPEFTVELVSYGEALEGYRALLSADTPVRLHEVRPANWWATRPPHEIGRVYGIRGTVRLRKAMGQGQEETFFELSRAAFRGADVVWLPWAHRHRIPNGYDRRVVATVHDLIMVEHADLLEAFTKPESLLSEERTTMERLFSSRATVVATSESTRATMIRLFGCAPERLDLVRVLSAHDRVTDDAEIPEEWAWAASPFLLCPANFSPHKNHDVLLAGLGNWAGPHPLVLTGLGADLPPDADRGRQLRAVAQEVGLATGKSLYPLGYIPDRLYFQLLKRARALIMPTLAEGGGSYPVLEAMLHGIPVICSDIPVLREQIAQTGGEVLWFDPSSADDLAARLRDLEDDYARYKLRAVNQASSLRTEARSAIAARYGSLLSEVASGRHRRIRRAPHG